MQQKKCCISLKLNTFLNSYFSFLYILYDNCFVLLFFHVWLLNEFTKQKVICFGEGSQDITQLPSQKKQKQNKTVRCIAVTCITTMGV